MRKLLSAFVAAICLVALQRTGASAATSGSLDPTFSQDGIAFLDQTGHAVAIQPDGKIVLAGGAANTNGRTGIGLTRYNPDGTLDRSLSGDGRVRTAIGHGVFAEAIAIQPNGRIVVGGRAETNSYRDALAMARYLPDGSLDTSFSGNGKLVITRIGAWNVSEVSDLTVGSNSTIVASAYVDDGTNYEFGVVRLDRRGEPDTAFSGDGIAVTRFGAYPGAFAEAIAVGSDGSIV